MEYSLQRTCLGKWGKRGVQLGLGDDPLADGV